jgi:hypothetical protein
MKNPAYIRLRENGSDIWNIRAGLYCHGELHPPADPNL